MEARADKRIGIRYWINRSIAGASRQSDGQDKRWDNFDNRFQVVSAINGKVGKYNESISKYIDKNVILHPKSRKKQLSENYFFFFDSALFRAAASFLAFFFS